MKRQKALEGLKIVNQMAGFYNQNPYDFGASGAVKEKIQSLWNRFTDVSSLLPMAQEYQKQLLPGAVDKGYFDPNLPQAEYNEHLLTMVLAGTMSQSSGGLGSGISKEAMEHAEEMSHVIGTDIDHKTAGQHIKMMQQTFMDTIAGYDKLIGMGAKPPAQGATPNIQSQPVFPGQGQPAPAQPAAKTTTTPAATPAKQTKQTQQKLPPPPAAGTIQLYKGHHWKFNGGANIPDNWSMVD